MYDPAREVHVPAGEVMYLQGKPMYKHLRGGYEHFLSRCKLHQGVHTSTFLRRFKMYTLVRSYLLEFLVFIAVTSSVRIILTLTCKTYLLEMRGILASNGHTAPPLSVGYACIRPHWERKKNQNLPMRDLYNVIRMCFFACL